MFFDNMDSSRLLADQDGVVDELFNEIKELCQNRKE